MATWPVPSTFSSSSPRRTGWRDIFTLTEDRRQLGGAASDDRDPIGDGRGRFRWGDSSGAPGRAANSHAQGSAPPLFLGTDRLPPQRSSRRSRSRKPVEKENRRRGIASLRAVYVELLAVLWGSAGRSAVSHRSRCSTVTTATSLAPRRPARGAPQITGHIFLKTLYDCQARPGCLWGGCGFVFELFPSRPTPRFFPEETCCSAPVAFGDAGPCSRSHPGAEFPIRPPVFRWRRSGHRDRVPW